MRIRGYFSIQNTGLFNIEQWRDFILSRLVTVGLALGVITCIPSVLLALSEGRTSIVIVDVLAFAWVIFICRNRALSFKVRALGFIVLLYGLGVFFMSLIGTVSQIYLMAVPVMTALFFGLWPAIGALLVNALTLFLFGIFAQGDVQLQGFSGQQLIQSFVITLNFVFVNAIMTISTGVLLRGLREALDQQHRMAFYDALSGLPNRRMLQLRLADFLENVSAKEQIGAILFIDLDHFKNVNDARGHTVGDQFLIQVGQRIKTVLRTDDMVARLGGDEFVVLLGALATSPDLASRLAAEMSERIRDTLAIPFELTGKPHLSSASIGITLLTNSAQSVDDVLREADTAMYRAKAAGRNQVAQFKSSMQTEINERLALEADLAQALELGQISVHLQSQCLVDGSVIGVELLMRWQHPQRGNVSPATFIPIAEKNGLILVLGEWVLHQGCLTALALAAAGRDLPVSINVSPLQFHQPDFVSQVRRSLDQTGAKASMLILEVTEGLLIEDIHSTVARMQELNQLGIRFSIDDFGTGYSSLGYLRQLPLYELKIDRGFVRDLPDDASATAIVKLILSMARELKLRVVAEGVETRAQADFLAACHCEAMQGFLFCRPQPMMAWLNRD